MLLEREQDSCISAKYSDVVHGRDRRAIWETEEVQDTNGEVGHGIDVEYENRRTETYDLVGVSIAGLNCAP